MAHNPDEADDIVTRLRERADAETADGFFADPLSREAADEIERLQTRVRQLEYSKDCLLKLNNKYASQIHKKCACDSSEGFVCVYHD